MFGRRLVGWFVKVGRQLPWRGEQRDPYAVLVSEIMLQQTQVATVIDYFNRWMQRFPDFATLARASESDVLHAWQGLGYYSRARNLHRAAKQVVEIHGGKLPADVLSLQNFPGLGRYTAGAVATFAFNLPTPIIDANIARVLARLEDLQFPIDTAGGQKALWELATRMQPQPGKSKVQPGKFNEALMELGALVCLPSRPRCDACPVRSFCKARQPELLPIKKPAAKLVPMREDCLWVLHGNALLLERQTGSRWRGLWKLPAASLEFSSESAGPAKPQPLLQTAYPFTNHRVTLRIYKGKVPKVLSAAHQWVPLESLASVAIPAPHRRAIEKILSHLKRKS